MREAEASAVWADRVLLLLQVAFVLAPVVFWEGGLLESEAALFVPRYLDDRGLAQKVFDPRANDFGAYQARELSYLVDWIDAQVLDGWLALGLPVFLPASALISSLLTVLVWRRGVSRVFPGARVVASGLLLLLYLSGFVVVLTSGVYYRSGKLLLAPALLALLFSVVEAARSEEPERPGRVAVLFALGILMSLLDRQGFFLVVTAAGLTALGAVVTGRLRYTALALGAAVAVAVLYNGWLGPTLVHLANGYRPRFKYQDVWLGAPFRKPERFVQAGEIVVENVGLLLGSLPSWAWAAVGVAGLAWAVKSRPREAGAVRPGLLRTGFPYVLLAAASQILMFAYMIVRHRAIYEFPDHRVWYYPLVLQVVLLFGLLLGLESLILRLRRRRVAVVEIALLAMVVSNVAHWPAHREALRPWFPHVREQSTLLKQSLRESAPHPSLAADQREFFRFMAERRGR